MGLVSVRWGTSDREVLRASQLVHELQASKAGLRESEARASLAVDAADIGLWIQDIAQNTIWASEKWRELFGFGLSESLEPNTILNRYTPTIAKASTNSRDGGRGSRWRQIPDGIPADAAGWRDAVDFVSGPCRA